MLRTTRAAILLLIVGLGPLVVGPSGLLACTGITIKPRDGSVIFARTMEFALDLQSNVLVIPRGREFVGSAPGGGLGLRWVSKYGVAGMNAFGRAVVVDGVNEAGLHAGIFYFPGYAKFQAVSAEERGRALAPHELATLLLGTCANVEEAVAASKGVRVGEVRVEEIGGVAPVHYVVNDASGRSAVLEYVDGRLMVHANPLGVMSNSPTFDWHMTNLDNYAGLGVFDPAKSTSGGVTLAEFGRGGGMFGLPGDFTPPSRFVRAVAFSKSAVPTASAKEGVLQAFHILNHFDLPEGAIRGVEAGRTSVDRTLWTTASDLKNRRYFFRTFEDSRIRMVDLGEASLGGKEIRTIPIRSEERIEDVTGQAR